MNITDAQRLDILGSLYSHITRLKEAGDPDALESAASFLEAQDPSLGCSGAAALLRGEAERVRDRLKMLSIVGIEFDFECGRAKLPSRGRRGPRPDVIAGMIEAAFDALDDPPEWYARETINQVREKITEVLIVDDDELADLSFARIKGVIDRHVKRQ